MLIADCGAGLRRLLILPALLAAATSGCVAPRSTSAPSLTDIYQQAVASPVRTSEDRDTDATRKPREFLEFAGVQPGMHVLDVSAGAGYTTQLLALVVGRDGTVWAQAPKLRPAFEERLAKHPQANIVPVVQPFDDPVPAGIPKLDLITLIWNYHDITYLPVDRAKMNQRLFEALKPGGHLVVIDHAAKAGSGTSVAKTLHRIDEALVISELRRAGFQLEQESDAFRSAADHHDDVVFHMDVPVDNFALRFVKP